MSSPQMPSTSGVNEDRRSPDGAEEPRTTDHRSSFISKLLAKPIMKSHRPCRPTSIPLMLY